MLDTIKSVMSRPLIVIGAHQLVFAVVLRRGEPTTVDFTAAGIPEDARILRVYYTVRGEAGESPLFPMQHLISQPEPPWIPRKLEIYPHCFDAYATTEKSELDILVSWLPANESDIVGTQLLAAFDAYDRADFQPATYDNFVIPANTAVEVTVGRLMTRRLSDDVSVERLDDFLNNAATFGYQLNVLLPVIVKAAKGPELPANVRGRLNRLRSLRNQLAHAGIPDQTITRTEAAECLCAAYFGVEYVRVIEQLLGYSGLR